MKLSKLLATIGRIAKIAVKSAPAVVVAVSAIKAAAKLEKR